MSLDPTSPPDAPAPSPVPPAAKSRDQRRRAVRARSINIRRIPKSQLALDARLYPEQPGVDYLRPQTRAECAEGPRPCPYVSCRYNLYLDVHPVTGSIKLNFPDLEVEDMAESCALDVALGDGLGLEETAAALNMVRERVRQIEVRVLAQLRGAAPALEALSRALGAPPGRHRGAPQDAAPAHLPLQDRGLRRARPLPLRPPRAWRQEGL